MMTTALNESATLRDLLFADTDGSSVDAVAGSLRDHGTVGPFLAVGPARTAAEDEIASATDKLLGLSLVDLLSAGWRKYDALKQAAQRTVAAPTSDEKVVLATHQIRSAHHPSVELYVDGRSMGTIEVNVCVAFTVTGVRAVISRGRLTKIETGSCTALGSLAVAGVDVAKRQRSLDLPGSVRLRGGIPLADGAANTAPTEALVTGGQPDSSTGSWHADPTGRYEFRWWDGSHWTERVAANGRTSTDPLAGPVAMTG